MMKTSNRQTGASLIEMVISVVIIAVVVTAVMMVVTQVARTSADPMVRIQAGAIAQAYMDEILVQSLDDPDGGESGGPEAGESRATFDDVSDYDGLIDSDGAHDQTGQSIAGLEAYNVSVTVTASSVGTYPAKRILVQVGFDGDPAFNLPLATYRMN